MAAGRTPPLRRGGRHRATASGETSMKTLVAGAVAAFAFVLGSCSSSGSSGSGGDRAAGGVRPDVQAAIDSIKARDPSIMRFFDTAVGWAVLPNVGKGGLIVGGAHGTGQVFERGALVGSCEMSQATIGLQVGGQEYSEYVFFKDQAALDAFKQNRFEFAANASAVAVNAGAA